MGIVADLREIGNAIHNNWLNFVVTAVIVFVSHTHLSSKIDKVNSNLERSIERLDKHMEDDSARFNAINARIDASIASNNARMDANNARMDALIHENHKIWVEIQEMKRRELNSSS